MKRMMKLTIVAILLCTAFCIANRIVSIKGSNSAQTTAQSGAQIAQIGAQTTAQSGVQNTQIGAVQTSGGGENVCEFCQNARVDSRKPCTESKNICKAFSVFDMVSPRVIEFYESEIAGERVVSDKSEKQIENIAQKYSISVKKAQGILLVYDFCKRTGGGIDFPTIAKMSDGKIIALTKERGKVYEKSISEGKRADLKRKSKEIFGISF